MASKGGTSLLDRDTFGQIPGFIDVAAAGSGDVDIGDFLKIAVGGVKPEVKPEVVSALKVVVNLGGTRRRCVETSWWFELGCGNESYFGLTKPACRRTSLRSRV